MRPLPTEKAIFVIVSWDLLFAMTPLWLHFLLNLPYVDSEQISVYFGSLHTDFESTDYYCILFLLNIESVYFFLLPCIFVVYQGGDGRNYYHIPPHVCTPRFNIPLHMIW